MRPQLHGPAQGARLPIGMKGPIGGAQQPIRASKPATAHLGVARGNGRLWSGNPSRLPYRVPDLPGGVSVNPRHPNQPGLVHYMPPGVGGGAGRIVRNPRPALARDPISNLARAVFLGLPRDILQTEAPVGRSVRAFARGHLPSRADAVAAASLLPFGPRAERMGMPEVAPGEQAGRERIGWRIHTPAQNETTFQFQGKPYDFRPFNTPGEREPTLMRNISHHGSTVGTAFGWLHTGLPGEPKGPLHRDPSTPPGSFDFSSLYVKPEFRQTPAGLQLMRDMLQQVGRHGLGARDITSLIVNEKLQRMVNRFMERQPTSFISHKAADEAALQMAQHMWMHQQARENMARIMARSGARRPPRA